MTHRKIALREEYAPTSQKSTKFFHPQPLDTARSFRDGRLHPTNRLGAFLGGDFGVDIAGDEQNKILDHDPTYLASLEVLLSTLRFIAQLLSGLMTVIKKSTQRILIITYHGKTVITASGMNKDETEG